MPELLRHLAAHFSNRVNNKGDRVLVHMRVIQGDGITTETLPLVLDAVLAAGFSGDNVPYGLGGGLLQRLDRDTQQFADKESCVKHSGQGELGRCSRSEPRRWGRPVGRVQGTRLRSGPLLANRRRGRPTGAPLQPRGRARARCPGLNDRSSRVTAPPYRFPVHLTRLVGAAITDP